MRPVLSEPQLYTLRDLREWVTIADVLDAHEMLDLKAAEAEKVRKAREKHGNR
jgi:hypothetical protein